MSRSSLWAVMSPVISITRVSWPTSRTAKVVGGSGMVCSFGVAHGARAVVDDGHEVRQPRDLEDLAVVLRQPARPHGDVGPPGLRQQPDDEGDARAVDVLGAFEVEGD